MIVGGLATWSLTRTSPDSRPITRLSMSVQPADQLGRVQFGSPRPSRTAVALSADGRKVVFSGTRGTTTQLFVRPIDQAVATPIPGTEGGIGPFLSPDGQWVGFFADGKLKKAPMAGGPSVVIASGIGGVYGASWGADGTIAFSGGTRILKVSAANGTPQQLTTPDAGKGERSHLLPAWLPDEKALLYTVSSGPNLSADTNIVVQSIATGERRTLIEGGADARYVSTGHLFYWQPKPGTLGTPSFSLMAVGIDTSKGFNTGRYHVLFDGSYQRTEPVRNYDVSPDGQRFIMLKPAGNSEPPTTAINLVLNWAEELKRRVPTK